MRPGWVVALAAGVMLAGCGRGPVPDGTASETPIGTASSGHGALIVYPRSGSAGAQRHPILADGTLGPPSALPWEPGAEATATLLEDALGPWALTALIQKPLTDVSTPTELAVRDVGTGEVAHRLDLTGKRWCGGPDGASYPCLLLDRDRMVRTTPLDGEHPGTLTISSTATGETLATLGPFPDLLAVNPTSSPDVLALASAGERSTTIIRLDVTTGQTRPIGTLAMSQPWLCTLGTDSVLTATGSRLQVIGPASVAPVEVPELAGRGPGVEGCSADGAHLYLRQGADAEVDEPGVLDALSLGTGTRAAVLDLAAWETVRVTR